MTFKKGLVIYFSATGNTKAMVELFSQEHFDIVPVKKLHQVNLEEYDTIVLGMSTWQRGMPPRPFIKHVDKIRLLSGKKIGIFGSGNTQYDYFCGALDLFEEILKVKNSILFVYKFEGYPTERAFTEMKKLIKSLEEKM